MYFRSRVPQGLCGADVHTGNVASFLPGTGHLNKPGTWTGLPSAPRRTPQGHGSQESLLSRGHVTTVGYELFRLLSKTQNKEPLLPALLDLAVTDGWQTI